MSAQNLVGTRVEIHPRFDRWMMGDRYGEIVEATRTNKARVRMDKSGKVITYRLDDLTRL